MLVYKVLRTLDADEADRLFDQLTEFGLGSWIGCRPDDRWELTFSFSCGCDLCPHPETVEEARELVERVLRAENLEFELVSGEMVE